MLELNVIINIIIIICIFMLGTLCEHVYMQMDVYMALFTYVHVCLYVWKCLYIYYVDDTCIWMHICIYIQVHVRSIIHAFVCGCLICCFTNYYLLIVCSQQCIKGKRI